MPGERTGFCHRQRIFFTIHNDQIGFKLMTAIPVNAFGTTDNRDATHNFFRMNTKPGAPDHLDPTLNQCFSKTGN